MDTNAYLRSCLAFVIDRKGQDVFLKAGSPPRMRIGGQVSSMPLKAIGAEELAALVGELLDPRQKDLLLMNKGVDFGFSYQEKDCRFRANAFYQQGNISLVFRLLWKGIPSFEDLRLPPVLEKIALEKSGIILIGGTVSSGKTSTVAAMIRTMNENVEKHIVTIEDPVEYLHQDGKCLIQQREIGQDAESFPSALKSMVRQSPDVIVIGEMRDAESFNFAVAAAEVGRLVIATIHAQSAPQIFERILGFFRREGERESVLNHFAKNMTCLAVQKLLLDKEGTGLVPAVEIMLGNYTVKQLIIENKMEKLPQAIRNAHQEGMQTMDQSLLNLWKSGHIDQESPARLKITADELKLRQVLYNVLSNAIKFTGQGFVHIRLSKEQDGGARITVEDSGPGIAPENQASIFRPYEQTGRATAASLKGTGLGLAISQKFVKMHGGKIWVESQTGKGSRFVVTLPPVPSFNGENTITAETPEKIG